MGIVLLMPFLSFFLIVDYSFRANVVVSVLHCLVRSVAPGSEFFIQYQRHSGGLDLFLGGASIKYDNRYVH
jgi:hypothetical protein